MPNDYIATSDIKLELDMDGDQLPSADETYNTYLALAATQASRAIDLFTGREAGAYSVSTDSIRYFNGSGAIRQLIDELAAEPTTVEVSESGVIDTAGVTTDGDYTTWGSTEYLTFPYNALTLRNPITEIRIDILNGSKPGWFAFPKAVKITGKWGYSTSDTISEAIIKSALIQSVRYFKRTQQAYADVGAITSLGQLRRVKKLDPDIEALLDAGLNRVAI